MIQRLFLLLTLIVTAASSAFADDADATLRETVSRLSAAKSIKANYTLTSSGESASGTLTFAGSKFVMLSPSVKTWYDGKTQWTYLVDNEEVNITEPTAAELQQVNPFEILSNYHANYTARSLKASAGTKKIELKAKNAHSDISSATVTISTANSMPREITVTMRNGRKATITISSVVKGGELPVSTFRFPAGQYPGVEIIDLR